MDAGLEVVHRQVTLGQVANGVDDNPLRPNRENRAMSLLASDAVVELVKGYRKRRVLSGGRETLWVVPQRLNRHDEAVVPSFGLLHRAILSPPARRLF